MEKGDKKKDYGNEALGMRVRELRQKKGLTHQELADLIGTSRGFITKLENGERDLKSWAAVELADALGTTCDYLLRGIEPENIDVVNELGLDNFSIQSLKALNAMRTSVCTAYFASSIQKGLNNFLSCAKGNVLITKMQRYLTLDFTEGKHSISFEGITNADTINLSGGIRIFFDDAESIFNYVELKKEDILAALLLDIQKDLSDWRDEIQNAKKD